MSRLELYANHFGSSYNIGELQSDFSKSLKTSAQVISCFKTVENKVQSVRGGVGSLSESLSHLQSRIQTEESRLDQETKIKAKTDNLIDTALSTDAKVAALVKKNKAEFYQKFPHLLPPPPPKEKSWLEQAWDNICAAGDVLGELAANLAGMAVDAVKKAAHAVAEFYQEHKKIIDTILIVVGAIAAIAAVVATGGAALVPLIAGPLIALGVSTATALSIAAAISTTVAAIAIISMTGSSAINIADLWLEIDNPIFNKLQKIMNITSGVSNALYSIGNIYNSIRGVDTAEFIARKKAIEFGKKGYKNLEPTSRMKIGEGRGFSQKQKEMIRQENMRRNGGVLRDDLTGKKGVIYKPGKGISKPPNALEVDHIIPKSNGGFNSFENARLINAPTNLFKSNRANAVDAIIDLIPDTPQPYQAIGFTLIENSSTLINISQNHRFPVSLPTIPLFHNLNIKPPAIAF